MKRPIESEYISQVAYTRALEDYCNQLEQPAQQQEPFAEVRLNKTGGNAGLSTHIVQLAEGYYPDGTKLYTTPQPAKRKPLTDEEIEEVSKTIERSNFFDCVIPFARAIEAAHGIKGDA